MKESDYINTGNLVKLVNANRILTDILVMDDTSRDNELLRGIVLQCRALEDQFRSRIKVTGE